MNIAEMEKLCSDLTAGPWKYHHCGEEDGDPMEEMYDWYVTGLDYLGTSEVRICSHEATNHRNGKFIAASREFVPFAIARIRELENANAKFAKVVLTAKRMVEGYQGGNLHYMTEALKELEKECP